LKNDVVAGQQRATLMDCGKTKAFLARSKKLLTGLKTAPGPAGNAKARRVLLVKYQQRP